MKKHTIIGTAGHIDHGKTALIKALTGIDTDQLKEERERGITIDIGFAYWRDNVTIIDVPGHEKFVRNMVAGVSTIDLFMLVIAANDGIMPQTIEHLDILKFFKVNNGLVALNKCDLVDDEWLQLMEEEVRDVLSDNGFEDIPIVPVSAVSGHGIGLLNDTLQERMNALIQNEVNRPFRMNVDRSFSVKGRGTIVTGTVLSGELRTGDVCQVLPGGTQVRVRGLQTHQHDVQSVTAGARAAVNLSTLSSGDLSRGSVIAANESLATTHEILAQVHTVKNLTFKIKRHSPVRVHLGTAELLGRMNWFESENILRPDQTYHVRIKLREEGVAAPGDALLLRSFSPVTTIAGGKILEAGPPRLRRNDENVQEYLTVMATGDLAEQVDKIIEKQGYRSVTEKELAHKLFEFRSTVETLLKKMVNQKKLLSSTFKNEQHYFGIAAVGRAVDLIGETIDRVIEKDPYKKGLNEKELQHHLKSLRMSPLFLQRTLQAAVNKKRIHFDGELYSTSDQVQAKHIEETKQRIVGSYRQQGFNPPQLNDLAESLHLDIRQVKNLCGDLARSGELLSVNGTFYLSREHFDAFLDFLRGYFEQSGELEIAAVREFTKSSRKFIIPLMEFCDARAYTVREGDLRRRGDQL